ncbi:family 1 glycosylhydrolase [Streptomyces sp. URMC 128]|uniref:family 1 glycosylhydrolase n=1 Tax=Streptomyces sp. URMC 128 TaxID=3423404 RepID=UPI003F1AD835
MPRQAYRLPPDHPLRGCARRKLLSFLWGAAKAAHQAEGNNINCDWWASEREEGPRIAERRGVACDSYHRYPQDIRLFDQRARRRKPAGNGS